LTRVFFLPGRRRLTICDRDWSSDVCSSDLAPRAEVPRDDDRALYRHAHPLEPLVVRRHAEVHVDERGGDIAVDGVGVVGRELLGLLARRGIAENSGLLELGPERGGGDELDETLL